MKPISINNQINNQINNNHNKDDDDKISINLKKVEFERLLNSYPNTINNTKEKIAEALGVYLTFSQTQRVDVFKAVQNYVSTEQIKTHMTNQTTKYIMSLFTFLTKSYTKFIYGLPKNFNFSEEFEPKNFQVGAADDSAIIVYGQEDIDKLSIYSKKFELIKNRLNNENINRIDDKYDDSWVSDMFNKTELDIIFVKMGGLNNVIKYSSNQLSESLLDILKVENE